MLKISIFILIFFILIFIIPIPIKFYLFYDIDKLTIKIFNKDIKVGSRKIKKETEKISDIKHHKKISSRDLKTVWTVLKNNKLKPSIKLNINVNYGLDDAAVTAIIYGFIYSLYSYVEYFFYSILNVKEMNFTAVPNYNKIFFNLELSGIIYVSLVKIIYIYILLRKKYNKKTQDIEGGIVYG